MSISDATKARAEAAFKRKEERAREGAQAWVEYEAKSRAVAENMKRLRALRLAKEAAEARGKKRAEAVSQSPIPANASNFPVTARTSTKSAKQIRPGTFYSGLELSNLGNC
jgi:hypothetical protein